MDISKIRNIRLIRRILITFSCQKKDLASGFKQPYIFFIYWSYGLIVTQHKNTLEFFFFFFIHLPKKFFESLVEWMPGAASWAKSIERSFLDYGHGSCWAESIETPERGRFFFYLNMHSHKVYPRWGRYYKACKWLPMPVVGKLNIV